MAQDPPLDYRQKEAKMSPKPEMEEGNAFKYNRKIFCSLHNLHCCLGPFRILGNMFNMQYEGHLTNHNTRFSIFFSMVSGHEDLISSSSCVIIFHVYRAAITINIKNIIQ